MQGRATPIRVREKALALLATGENYSSTSRLLDLSKQTVRQLSTSGSDFSQLRSDIEQHYIIEAWSSVISGHNELLRRLNDKEELSHVSTVELATIIEKVHRTVTAVAANVIAIQATMVTDSTDDLEREAYTYIGQQYGLTVEQVKEKLSKV